MSEKYQALYRKWRPMTFDDVVGQNHITETLKHELASEKIGHAYLFCGTRGTGKTTTAKIFSRAVNCEILKTENPVMYVIHARVLSTAELWTFMRWTLPAITVLTLYVTCVKR